MCTFVLVKQASVFVPFFTSKASAFTAADEVPEERAYCSKLSQERHTHVEHRYEKHDAATEARSCVNICTFVPVQ
jgi:hypothetical protein